MLCRNYITVALVGCSAQKRQGTHKARDLYVSDLFVKSLRYAEAHAEHVFVVSAKHGLLALTEEVESYDARLTKPDRCFGLDVIEALDERFPGKSLHLVILAGADYADSIEAELPVSWTAEKPLEGLGIGERLAHLKRAA